MDFDKLMEEFDKASSDRRGEEVCRDKLTGALNELNEIKRTCKAHQKELREFESRVRRLKDENKSLRVELIKTLIEKEELVNKKATLTSNIEQLSSRIKSMDKENSLSSIREDVDQMTRIYSSEAQLALISKIEEAKCRLVKLGIPPNYLD